MTQDDATLDDLEKLIPPLSGSAVTVAYWQALAAGNSVLETDDGAIYEVFPDGSRTLVKTITPPIPVVPGATYELK